MKACVLHGIGDLRCEEVETPTARDGEVMVRVRACGVCGSDIPRVFSKGTYSFPTIPGHEFAGEVAADGRRAVIFPLIPCGQCPLCKGEHYAQCLNYDYLGSRRDGGFAEYVSAPEWNILPIPDGLSWEEAAMTEPAAVALHALRQGNLRAGETVMIFGAGPIGLLLAAWAEAIGANSVMLADIDEARLEHARLCGHANVYNVRDGDVTQWVMDATGHGADVVVEATGASAALEQCMTCARPFGRVVLLGNPAGAMAMSQQNYWQILRKELTLTGSWNSIYGVLDKDEWVFAIEAMASARINVKPIITHRVTLDELPQTLANIRDRNGNFGKVMCVND